MSFAPIISVFSTLQQRLNSSLLLNIAENRLPLSIPASELPSEVRQCATTMRYHQLLASIAWHNFPERDLALACPQSPIPYRPFAAACLVKLNENKTYTSQLYRYLAEHPLLIWLLGFPLARSRTQPYGFDAAASLPTTRHFNRMLRKIPNTVFQFLLSESVRLIQAELSDEIADFGQAISLDTKHIIAWVKENNPKQYVTDRFNKEEPRRGDPDCRLGVKRKSNQRKTKETSPETPTTEAQPASQVNVSEYYWGYASGVVATKVPEWGEIVLAELTQTLDRPDVSYFQPLMAATERQLGFRPAFGAFDAAFDAFYVYEYFHPKSNNWRDGFAAVPFSKRNTRRKTFSPEGEPHCEADLPMPLQRTYMNHTSMVSHERGVYTCPIIGIRNNCPIDHVKWPQGGCVHKMPTSVGARARHQIDRDSALYKDIYRQRTATERINSQAVELGIERPKLRNQQAIANQNTLIYVLINLRTLQRIRQRKRQTNYISS